MAIQCFPHFPWAISLMSSTLGSPEVQLKNHVSHHVHIAPRNGWAFYCTSCLMREALPW
jgi:hypothetical protein